MGFVHHRLGQSRDDDQAPAGAAHARSGAADRARARGPDSPGHGTHTKGSALEFAGACRSAAALARDARGDSALSLMLFYASDIHGSDVLWRKFINAGKFYGANILVMGGDIAGKAVVPITLGPNGHVVPHPGGTRVITDESELAAAEKRIRDQGFYPYRTTEDEVAALRFDAGARDEVFAGVMRKSLESWIALAKERLQGTGIKVYVMIGNDDDPDLRNVLSESDTVEDPEDVV